MVLVVGAGSCSSWELEELQKMNLIPLIILSLRYRCVITTLFTDCHSCRVSSGLMIGSACALISSPPSSFHLWVFALPKAWMSTSRSSLPHVSRSASDSRDIGRMAKQPKLLKMSVDGNLQANMELINYFITIAVLLCPYIFLCWL